MNKEKQLEKDYPVGAMIEIFPYRRARRAPAPACYGIIVDSDIECGGVVRCFVHTMEGQREYWSSMYVNVVARP